MLYPDSDDLATAERTAYINGDTQTAALLAHIIDTADETETHEETLGKVYDAATGAEKHANAIGELLDNAEGNGASWNRATVFDGLRASKKADREAALQEFIESVRAELSGLQDQIETLQALN